MRTACLMSFIFTNMAIHGTGLIGTEHPWFADFLFWLTAQGL